MAISRGIKGGLGLIGGIVGLSISPSLYAAQCPIGTQVKGEMGGGKTGTIAEIGSARPYEGWYRIVFDWNGPRGDWYNPAMMEINRAGTKDRCSPDDPAVAAPAVTPANPIPAPQPQPQPQAMPMPAPAPTPAQTPKTCGVGSQVRGEMGGGKTGQIAEIGSEPPHVGWYRIVFDWNAPRGDWYDPSTLPIQLAGNGGRCAQTAAAPVDPVPMPPPAAQAPMPPPVMNAPPVAATNPPPIAGCPMNEPAGVVTKTAGASSQLFQRVIYEIVAAKANPQSVSAPKKIGMTFLDFQMGTPYENDLSSTRFGDKRRYDGAPVGVMIYPYKSKDMTCELYDRSVRRWVTENEGNCFKTDLDEWSCSRRTTKFVENTLLPLN